MLFLVFASFESWVHWILWSEPEYDKNRFPCQARGWHGKKYADDKEEKINTTKKKYFIYDV